MTVVYELLSTLFLTYGCIISARKTTTTGKFSLNRKGLAFFIFREGLLYTRCTLPLPPLTIEN